MNSNKDFHYILTVLNNLEKIHGRKRFQKLIFLLKEKYEIPFSYNFISHYYGPYSRGLQIDIDNMENSQMIEVSKNNYPISHKITKNGKKNFKLLNESNKKLVKALKELNSKSTSELVEMSKLIMESK